MDIFRRRRHRRSERISSISSGNDKIVLTQIERQRSFSNPGFHDINIHNFRISSDIADNDTNSVNAKSMTENGTLVGKTSTFALKKTDNCDKHDNQSSPGMDSAEIMVSATESSLPGQDQEMSDVKDVTSSDEMSKKDSNIVETATATATGPSDEHDKNQTLPRLEC